VRLKNLDNKQRRLAGLALDGAFEADGGSMRPGECVIDVVYQDAGRAGLTSALRQAEDATVVLVNAKDQSIFFALQDAAKRLDAIGWNYEQLAHEIIYKASGKGERAVCVAIDHAGAVSGKRIEMLYRVFNELAYRMDVSIRLLVIATKVRVWDPAIQDKIAQLPKIDPILNAHQRSWVYERKKMTFSKPAETPAIDHEDATLLEAEPQKIVKIA
jgi:hypothetical protein